MRIQKFNDLFNAIWSNLDFDEKQFGYFRGLTARFLDSLGHIEYDFENRYIYSCKSMLVLLPTKGVPRFLLTGARNSNLLKELKKKVKKNKQVLSISQNSQLFLQPFVPSAIYVDAVDFDILSKIASELNIDLLDFSPSFSILNYSDGIEEIEKELRFEKFPEINWSKRTFSLEKLYFTSVENPCSSDQYRFVEYSDRFNSKKLHWLWNKDTRANTSRDWGRYILLSKHSRNILMYDSKKYLLAVPSTVPLPILIARALTLCTGLVPRLLSFDDRDYLVYSSINPQLAEFVGIKLGQSLNENTIED